MLTCITYAPRFDSLIVLFYHITVSNDITEARQLTLVIKDMGKSATTYKQKYNSVWVKVQLSMSISATTYEWKCYHLWVKMLPLMSKSATAYELKCNQLCVDGQPLISKIAATYA